MYVTRHTTDYFQYRFDNIHTFIKDNKHVSNVIKSNIDVLLGNINLPKANTTSILKSIILIRYLKKLFNHKLGIIKSDMDYFNHIIRTHKREYTSIIRLIKLVSFIIEKYVRREQAEMKNDYLQYKYQEHYYNIESLDIIIAFCMFDKYFKKYKTITPVILLNDTGFVMMLDNYMNQKTKYVNQGLINDLSNTSLNEYVIHGNEDDITTLVDKDFAKYCSSYRFTKDINHKYDNVFNVRTIFKTVDAFKNINVQYAESIVDSSFNDDDVSEHTELDIIQDDSDSDSDNFDNDDTSENMSENYDDELNEELDDYERQGYQGHHADSDLDDIDDDDDGL
jgi:hypothetical protein